MPAGVSGSESAAVREPNTLIAQVGLLRQQVVVAVVVQDPKPVAVSQCGDEKIHGWDAVMPHASELSLRVQRSVLDLVIDLHAREREQITDQCGVVRPVTRRVPGLKQKRQTDRESTLLKPARDLVGPRLRKRRAVRAAPRPSCQAAARCSRSRPAAGTDLIGGVNIDAQPPGPHSIGKSRPTLHGVGAHGAQRRKLGASAKHNQLSELNPVGAQLAAQLIQRSLNARGLGNSVTAVIGRHQREVYHPVSHHR